MTTVTRLDEDAVMLQARIPEHWRVEGLEYGSHLSLGGRSGYYVRPVGGARWGVAKLTPASDELADPDGDETQDQAIVREIRDEMAWALGE